MSFASYSFLLFLFLLFIVYYIVPKRVQWIALLVASYIFYSFAGWGCLGYITLSSVSSYIAAMNLSRLNKTQAAYLKANKASLTPEQKTGYKAKMNRSRRAWFLGALLINIGALCLLKYTNFTIANINSVLALFKSGNRLGFLSIALPMGISYYTFQSVGYLIDVQQKKYEPERNIFRFMLFVSFFPQLIQGPISRYDELSQTLYGPHRFEWKQFSFGLWRILWGFFKKLVIADRMAVAVNELAGSPEKYPGVFVAALMVFYALELYTDFTGGIDITIGVAEALGIKVAENFIRPYFSKNIEEYWRRWHITMGTWFRDYIFYPLSVSKFMLNLSKSSRKRLGAQLGKRVPVYTATVIVWFATGIWHGASWNFIVWGLLNGIVIIISQELTPFYNWFHKHVARGESRAYDLFQIARTFALMCSLRLLDCYRDVPVTFRMFGTIFTDMNWSALTDSSFLKLGISGADYIVLICGTSVLLTVSLIGRSGSVREKIWNKHAALSCSLFVLLLLITLVFGAYGVGYDSAQFIYNQF